METTWWLRVGAERGSSRWNWDAGSAPDVRKLLPVRSVHSNAKNRHVPVKAFSTTTGGFVHLESGLEHDLLRRLDRLPATAWLVAQPFELRWGSSPIRRHIPDLLHVDRDGLVTAWDVRGVENVDSTFERQSDMTRRECSEVGWRYCVFHGLGAVEMLNLLWLHGFRRPSRDQCETEKAIRDVMPRTAVALSELFDLDDGSGIVKSAVWHMIWSGAIETDLNQVITPESRVVVRYDDV